MSLVRSCGGGLVLLVLSLALSAPACQESPVPSQGWGLVDLPETPPSAKEVIEAAASVVQERYPMAAVSREGRFVVALSPVAMQGGSKTRKQISVIAQRNSTGAYEPIVRVRWNVEVDQPPVAVDPDSANVARAQPLMDDEWIGVDYLRYEEQQIYDAILARLGLLPAPAEERLEDVPADELEDQVQPEDAAL